MALTRCKSVTDRPRELAIRSRQYETEQVLVGVTDGGIGISAENADKLFNGFFTTESSGIGNGAVDLPFNRRRARRSMPFLHTTIVRSPRVIHSPRRDHTGPLAGDP